MTETKYRILVIDDDPDVVELVRDTLEPEGYLVDTALSFKDSELYLSQTVPDLIVLDLTLPDGDGYELCRMIKRNDMTCNTPVLILSGTTRLDAKVKGFVDGARKYITKPFELNTLTDSVSKLLKRDRQ
jgi:two-component system alkaline phosphatase synthesis response regulator PhoP